MRWEWLDEGKTEELFQSMHSHSLIRYIEKEMIECADEKDKICAITAYTTKGCQGVMVFDNEEAETALRNNVPYIYYVGDMFRGYEDLAYTAEGVISEVFDLHAMSKNAKRNYYYGKIDEESKKRIINEANRVVTISPKQGYIFGGRHDLVTQRSMDNTYVRKLFVFLKDYVKESSDSIQLIKAWQFIDIIFGTYIEPYSLRRKKCQPIYKEYPIISLPDGETFVYEDIGRGMTCNYDIEALLLGVIMSIKRVMGTVIPTGRHGKYFRPLFNPMNYIYAEEYEEQKGKCIDFIQLTGIEFFDLDKYASVYHDIHSVKIYFETYASDYNYNFLDFSNPNCVDIVLNKLPRRNVLLYINEEKIPKEKVIEMFSNIRKREFGW